MLQIGLQGGCSIPKIVHWMLKILRMIRVRTVALKKLPIGLLVGNGWHKFVYTYQHLKKCQIKVKSVDLTWLKFSERWPLRRDWS